MQSSWRANGEIRQRHVVIDGAHQPDNPKMSMLSCLIIGNFLYKRCQQYIEQPINVILLCE